MARSYLSYPTAAVGAAAPAAATTQPVSGVVLPEMSTRLNALDYTPVTGATAPAPRSRFADPDGDGLIDAVEFKIGTDPDVADTDGDGISDGAEVTAATDPLDPDDPA